MTTPPELSFIFGGPPMFLLNLVMAITGYIVWAAIVTSAIVFLVSLCIPRKNTLREWERGVKAEYARHGIAVDNVMWVDDVPLLKVNTSQQLTIFDKVDNKDPLEHWRRSL